MDNTTHPTDKSYVFKTVDSKLKQHNGSTVKIEKVYDKPDQNHDAEVLPMYDIRITSGANEGQLLEAFHDELQ